MAGRLTPNPKSPPSPSQHTRTHTQISIYDITNSACLTAMRKFARRFPQHKPRAIAQSIARGKEFIKAVRATMMSCTCVLGIFHSMLVFEDDGWRQQGRPLTVHTTSTHTQLKTTKPHTHNDIKQRRRRGQIQRPDGSWYGSWGICFTYGTWFGIEVRPSRLLLFIDTVNSSTPPHPCPRLFWLRPSPPHNKPTNTNT